MPAQPAKGSFPTSENQEALLRKLREWALVGEGLMADNRLGRFLRVSDLVDAGIIQVRQSVLNGGGAGGGTGPGSRPVPVDPAVDRTPPPRPGGFIATAGKTQILFETAAPIYRQGHGHARTKIYAAPATPLPTFADAVLYTDFPGNIGVAPFDPASDLRLWATWTSVDGVESEPAGGTNGVAAATGLLEDQHIANMAVGKLLAGSLAVGQYIQSADYVAGVSGWRIQTLSGGGAFLEVRGNAVFAGTIFALAGEIGGITVGSNYLRSTNYILGTQGFNFQQDGTGQIGGVLFTVDGIQSSNYVAGVSGFRWDYSGICEAIGMNLYGGTLIASLIRNTTDSVHFDLSATGSAMVLRVGALTDYGPYAGSHYKVEIYADGAAFFGREVVAGGTLKASGTYAIPDAHRPAVIFEAVPTEDFGGAGP